MHQYNTTLVRPSSSTPASSSPTTPNTPSNTATLEDPASPSTANTATTPSALNDPASISISDSPLAPNIHNPAEPSPPTLCSCPNPPLALSNPTPADSSLLNALTIFHTFDSQTNLIDSAIHNTAKKLVWASEEQQEEVEYILLAAEKLQMAMCHVKEATLDVFFRELEADEGKVFEELVEKKVGDGVLEMIEELCEKVLDVVGSVEVPDSESEGEDAESDETSDGDYSPGDEDSDEDDDFEEDESMDEGSADNGGDSGVGSRMDLPNFHRAGEHRSNSHHDHHDHHDHHNNHNHKTQHAVQFLEAAKLMIASLTQTELWAVLHECRKIVELSCGRKVVLPPSLLTDRPGLEKSRTYHPGGLGDAVVAALAVYYDHVTKNDGAIDKHIIDKALDFIDFVKKRNETASGVRREHSWFPEEEYRKYYEANIPCTLVFAKHLREYAATVLDNGWKFDGHVVACLDALIREARGEAKLEHRSHETSPPWQGQHKIASLIRGYTQLCKDERLEVDEDILRLALEIVDKAKRHEKHHADCECESCGRQMEKACSGNCGEECVCVVACMLDPLDEEGVDRNSEDEDDTIGVENVGSRVLSPIDEDREAEEASEGHIDTVVREGHLLVMTEDGDFEDFAFKIKTAN